MSRLKLDQDDLALSSLMERITHARVKDCFKDIEVIYFVVAPGEMGKAVGKNGSNIRKAQEELGKRIKVIEFKDNAVDFVKSIIYPLYVESVIEEGGFVLIKDSNKKTKSLLIGRESRNLQLINRAVKRFYNVEVKVV